MELDIQKQIMALLSALVDDVAQVKTSVGVELAEMKASIAALSTAGAGVAPLAADRPFMGLPSRSKMHNLELSFFDNGSSQGRSRFKLKAEVNLSNKAFNKTRDVVEFADMFPAIQFETKLRQRTRLSEAYRETLLNRLRVCIKHFDSTMMGMFSKRDGEGIHWYDHQFVVVAHNKAYEVQSAILFIGDDMIEVDGWSTRHPITGKDFAIASLKSKACVFPNTIGDDEGESVEPIVTSSADQSRVKRMQEAIRSERDFAEPTS